MRWQTGALAEAGGIWRLRAGGLRPTARLAELVALRLGDLSDAERAVLELLALGEPLGQARLDRLADPAAVAALERRGLIASRTGRPPRRGVARPSRLRGRGPSGDHRAARACPRPVAGRGGRGDRRTAPGGHLARWRHCALPAVAAAPSSWWPGRPPRGRATTIPLPSGWPGPPWPRAAGSKPGSWPPRPPTSRVGPARPSASSRRWPPTPPATRSGPGWLWSATTTPYFLQGREADSRLLDDAGRCRHRSVLARQAAFPAPSSSWASAAGRRPRWRLDRPCSSAGLRTAHGRARGGVLRAGPARSP